MTLEDELPDLFDELAAAHSVGSPPELSDDVSVRATPTSPPGRSPVLVGLAAAACVALVVGGLAFLSDRDTAPAVSDQPAASTSTVAPDSTPPTTPGAPTETDSTWQLSSEPTAFPVLEELPEGLSATTYAERMGDGWTSPRTEALIGRLVDGVLIDTIQLEVWPEPFELNPMQGRTPTDDVVMGQPASIHDRSESGSTPTFVVAWGSGPYFTATGASPLAFLHQLDPDSIEATTTGDDEPPQVSIGTLPGDFEVIVAPTGITGDATVFATLSIGADNYDISVHTSDRVVGMAATGRPLRATEVNGRPGWTYLSSAVTQDITWQVDESTYAYLKVNDGSTADEALALANQIDFVDFDTWTARYSPDIADVPATTAPDAG